MDWEPERRKDHQGGAGSLLVDRARRKMGRQRHAGYRVDSNRRQRRRNWRFDRFVEAVVVGRSYRVNLQVWLHVGLRSERHVDQAERSSLSVFAKAWEVARVLLQGEV
jgi:hypothetical protein